MSKVDFKLNLNGLNELMKSQEMQTHLQQAADTVKELATGMAVDKDAEYTADVVVVRYVAIGRVHAGNTEALLENYSNNTLLKALGSAGLPMSKGGSK